jgi:nucleotide-binding universal stress UspA family protein
MKQLLVALNFSEQSLVIFKYAMKLAQHFGANVDFAYIVPETQIGEEEEEEEEEGKYYSKV